MKLARSTYYYRPLQQGAVRNALALTRPSAHASRSINRMASIRRRPAEPAWAWLEP